MRQALFSFAVSVQQSITPQAAWPTGEPTIGLRKKTVPRSHTRNKIFGERSR